MKHLFTLSLALLVTLPAIGQQVMVGYSSRPWFPVGPQRLWLCNEGTGDYIYSRRGTADTGTLSGTTKPSWTTFGGYKGLDFNGSTAYVECGANSIVQPDAPWSICATISPDTVSGLNVICSNWVSGTAGFVLWRNGTGLMIDLLNAAGTTYKRCTSELLLLEVGGVYRIVVTHNGNNSVTGMLIYVNGRVVSDTDTSNGACGALASAAVAIGRRAAGSYFDGKISEVAFYARCLLPEEISGQHQRSK